MRRVSINSRGNFAGFIFERSLKKWPFYFHIGFVLQLTRMKMGDSVINEKQAKIGRRIFNDYLNGKGPNRIAKELEHKKVPKWDGE